MRTSRRPQDLEDCWQCSISGWQVVYEDDLFEDEYEGRQAFQPRCPCHNLLMRRATASWHGVVPGWVGKGVCAVIVLVALWTILAVLCAIPSTHFLVGC